MSKVRIELNSAGIRELLLSDEVESLCESKANEVMARAGDGYEVTTYKGKNRANASVHVATDKAYRDNLKNNTLLKALWGG